VGGPTEAIVREMYEELMNKGNAEVLDRYVDPEFVYQNPMKPVKGRQQIVDLVEAQRRAFRNFRLNVDFIVIGESSAAISWTVTGIHEKEFFGYAPSGKEIRFSGITIHRFENGRSAEAWSYSNMTEALGGG